MYQEQSPGVDVFGNYAVHSRLYVLKKYHVRRKHCKTAVHGNQKQHHKYAGQKKLFNFSFAVFKPCAECKRRKTHGNCTNEPWQTCTFNTECIDQQICRKTEYSDKPQRNYFDTAKRWNPERFPIASTRLHTR